MQTIGRPLPAEFTILAAHAQIPDHVVFRSFAHETVVLNLQTGRYHGLNPTGGRILELLVGAGTIGDAARQLAEEYKRPIEAVERDVGEFCRNLHERGLIEMSMNGRH